MRQNTVTVNKKDKNDDTDNHEIHPIVDKNRTFFCSELVAKAYKVCGIMIPTD